MLDGDPLGLLRSVLDGQFCVVALVGEGDLSIVYKGRHVGDDTPVAVKCLNLPDTLDPALTRPVVESFDESGRLHHRLARGSPHIARFVAAGRAVAPRTGATVPYLVREWFEGESLATDLSRRRRQGQRGRRVEEALALLEPAIEGISYAHEKGVTHLSLAPDNLFVAKVSDSRSSLKVLDFGAARMIDHVARNVGDGSVAPSGLRLLRPTYAAPEQLSKEVGAPGPWTDVYALALITMELLSDRVVFGEDDTPAIVERALDEQKRPTPSSHGLKLPRGLDLALTRAVALEPEGRQKDARSFWNEIRSAVPRVVSPDVPILGGDSGTELTTQIARRPEPPRKGGIAPPLPHAKLSAAPAETPPAPSAMAPNAPPVAAQPLPSPGIPSDRPTPMFMPAAMPFRETPSPATPRAEPLGQTPIEAPPLRRVTSAFPPAPAFPARPSSRPPAAPESPKRRPILARLSTVPKGILIAGTALALVASVTLLVLLSRTPEKARARTEASVSMHEPPSTATITPPAARSGPLPIPSGPPPAPPALEKPGGPTSAQAAARATAPPEPPPVVAAATPAAAPPAGASHPAPQPHRDRFSRAAALHATRTVTRKLLRCRHGRFWGHGYATVAFANDGSVSRVLIDPPFSRTVTGQCVAKALSTAHTGPFDGRLGYLRMHFYVAP